MTLPASGTITVGDILTELGKDFPVTLPDTDTRWLADKPTGSITIPTDFYGKSAAASAAVTDSAVVEGTAIGTLSIGAAAPKRRVALTVFQNSVYGGDGDVNITCGGVTMSKQTIFSGSIGAGATGRMTVYWLDVATGTTAAFVASSSIGAQAIVWRVLGVRGSISDHSSAVNAASSVSLPAIDIPANGVLLVHASLGEGTSALTFSGTGITEVLDTSMVFTGGSTGDRVGAAKRETTSAVSGATAGVSNTGSNVAIIFGATFGR